MTYTLEERIEIIFIYGAESQCARRTANEFNARHLNKHVSHRYVLDLVEKFKETGSVANKKRTQPRIVNEDSQIEILGQFAANHTSSIRQVRNFKTS